MCGAITCDYFSTANAPPLPIHPPTQYQCALPSHLLPLCFLSFHIVLCFNTFAAGTSLNTAAKPQINDQGITLLVCLFSFWLHCPFLSSYPSLIQILSLRSPCQTSLNQHGTFRESKKRVKRVTRKEGTSDSSPVTWHTKECNTNSPKAATLMRIAWRSDDIILESRDSWSWRQR